MGNKMRWFKMWADDFLADVKIRRLTWSETGINVMMWSILHSQTDEVGVFIINGHVLTEREIQMLLFEYGPPANDFRSASDKAGNDLGSASDKAGKGLRRRSGGEQRWFGTWVRNVLHSGLYAQDDRGAWYSPRMVKDDKTHRVAKRAGEASARKRGGSQVPGSFNKSFNGRVKQSVKPEEEEEEEEEKALNGIRESDPYWNEETQTLRPLLPEEGVPLSRLLERERAVKKQEAQRKLKRRAEHVASESPPAPPPEDSL